MLIEYLKSKLHKHGHILQFTQMHFWSPELTKSEQAYCHPLGHSAFIELLPCGMPALKEGLQWRLQCEK